MLKPLFIGFVAIVAAVGLVSLGYWYGFHSNNPTAVSFSPIMLSSDQPQASPSASVTPGPSASQAPISSPVASGFACPANIPQGYELASGSWNGDQTNMPADEFLVDLKGDGTKELVRVYDQQLQIKGSYGERSMPIIVKVFSGADASCRELFSYTASQQPDGNGVLWGANESGLAYVSAGFFGDQKQAFVFEPISTGYGSGSSYPIDILAWQGGSFQVIQGPTMTELDIWKFNGTDFPGETILVARGIWDSTGTFEAHFSPHRVHFESWQWADGQYVKTDLGTTQNKYSFSGSSASTIDDIIKAEPNVLNPQ